MEKAIEKGNISIDIEHTFMSELYKSFSQVSYQWQSWSNNGFNDMPINTRQNMSNCSETGIMKHLKR